MKTLSVETKERNYPIYIGRNLFGKLDEYLTQCPGGRRIVITDDAVAEHYLQPVREAAKVAGEDVIVFANGEQSKTLATCETMYTALLERAVSRDALIIALGGGVVGDMAGFIAATYLRGISFAQLPTTLLAQVDSAVGGKTGVNHPLGKNMVGAFYQPQCVVSDLDVLKTLPPRHFVSALAEVIKYGLILDAGFFSWLRENLDALLKHDEAALTHVIYHSCEIKADVVAKDALEKSGHRALLNFGHTFGHALEAILGYGDWLHGEAVGCGMVLAARLSQHCGLITRDDADCITDLIARAGLPCKIPLQADTGKLIDAMRLDKKNLQTGQRFVLLKAIGEATISDAVGGHDVEKVLNDCR